MALKTNDTRVSMTVDDALLDDLQDIAEAMALPVASVARMLVKQQIDARKAALEQQAQYG
jgi:antitoxin component of RelBE/YafQ-DinJ toxin-antitoxin module